MQHALLRVCQPKALRHLEEQQLVVAPVRAEALLHVFFLTGLLVASEKREQAVREHVHHGELLRSKVWRLVVSV